jgi:hypothetical protein
VAPPEPVASVVPAASGFPAGFYADPDGRCEARWWDGYRWTAQVVINGRPGVDTGATEPTAAG